MAGIASPLDRFQAAVPGGGRKVGGQYMFRCPAHADRRPSLAVCEVVPGGTLLVFDHGGCNTEDVLDAVGLCLADLYPENT